MHIDETIIKNLVTGANKCLHNISHKLLQIEKGTVLTIDLQERLFSPMLAASISVTSQEVLDIITNMKYKYSIGFDGNKNYKTNCRLYIRTNFLHLKNI